MTFTSINWQHALHLNYKHNYKIFPQVEVRISLMLLLWNLSGSQERRPNEVFSRVTSISDKVCLYLKQGIQLNITIPVIAQIIYYIISVTALLLTRVLLNLVPRNVREEGATGT
jgi:hypothetical protein